MELNNLYLTIMFDGKQSQKIVNYPDVSQALIWSQWQQHIFWFYVDEIEIVTEKKNLFFNKNLQNKGKMYIIVTLPQDMTRLVKEGVLCP